MKHILIIEVLMLSNIQMFELMTKHVVIMNASLNYIQYNA